METNIHHVVSVITDVFLKAFLDVDLYSLQDLPVDLSDFHTNSFLQVVHSTGLMPNTYVHWGFPTSNNQTDKSGDRGCQGVPTNLEMMRAPDRGWGKFIDVRVVWTVAPCWNHTRRIGIGFCRQAQRSRSSSRCKARRFCIKYFSIIIFRKVRTNDASFFFFFKRYTKPSLLDCAVVFRAVPSGFQEINNFNSVDFPCYLDENGGHHSLTI